MVWRHGKSHSPTNESLCDPKTAAVFKSERNTLGHDTHVLGMSVLSGTMLDWPGFVVLYIFHGLVPAPGPFSPLHPCQKRRQQLLSSTIADADAGSWSCQGYISGPEWEPLTSSSARDGRMAD